HAPNVGPERHLPTVRVVRVVEIVVAFGVRAERGVVDIRSERQWRTAAPASDQLRGDQFPILLSASIRLKEPIERANTRLILAKAHIGAGAAEDGGLRHGQGDTGLTWIAENEFTCLDERPLAGQRVDAAAFDRRLIDAVLVAQRIEVARLGTEVLHRQNT